MDLAPTPYVDEEPPLSFHICPGTIKAYRVRSGSGVIMGHFDTEADAGHACRSAVAAAARLVGREAV